MLKRVRKWLSEQPAIQRFNRHRKEFKYIWILLFVITGTCLLAGCNVIQWSSASFCIKTILGLIAVLFFIRPMNAVYGLMGTSGSIRLFFFTFFLITFLFAWIYQSAFFKDAGISYDVNQPHIDYNLYIQGENDEKEVIQSDTLIYKKKVDNEWKTEVVVQEYKLSYQPIGFTFIWRNTILTALMQEPTDFFLAASTYNESMVDPKLSYEEQIKEIQLDKEKAMTFQRILILQIFISWIFFGVFISLLYNKFRYES